MKPFSNLNPLIKPKGLLDVLKWKFSSKKPEWPPFKAIAKSDVPPKNVAERLRVSYVGHVSFLLQFASLNILTDPVWSHKIGPMGLIGPERVVAPGIKFEDLPKIDLIVISHNHYDHMDLATIKKICERDQPVIITPLENDKILRSVASNITIITLNWFEERVLNLKEQALVIALEPAQHWSARGLFDRDKALWGTFIIKTKMGAICFIGDSGYDAELFKNIAKRHPDILLSLIPIGAFEPRWFMKDVHMNPEEAVLVHQDLQSKNSIASHFDTFHLADDVYGQAPAELAQARIKHQISSEQFITPNTGDVYWFG